MEREEEGIAGAKAGRRGCRQFEKERYASRIMMKSSLDMRIGVFVGGMQRGKNQTSGIAATVSSEGGRRD